MVVRAKRSERIIRRRRQAPSGHGAEREGAALPEGPAARPVRRLGGASQDSALYSCQCGMVFDAPVSTSVGCPNCGCTQAW